MVKVLVGQYVEPDGFTGFWAEFEGEEISSYEDKGVIHTLYKSTAYRWEAYRVHIDNKTNPQAPVYQLLPYGEDQRVLPTPTSYSTPYTKEQIANKYPLFVEHLDYLETRNIDAGPKMW